MNEFVVVLIALMFRSLGNSSHKFLRPFLLSLLLVDTDRSVCKDYWPGYPQEETILELSGVHSQRAEYQQCNQINI